MALSSASPFHHSVVGVADRFILGNDALVYKPSPDELRILLLDGSAHEEIHVDLCRLREAAFPGRCDWSSEVAIDPLHYSDAILSVLCKVGSQYHLIICNVKTGTIPGTQQVEGMRGIFARNNDRYFYVGSKKLLLGGHSEWIIRGFDLEKKAWLSETSLPSEFAGSQLRQDVCFEIFDGYLYGTSSAPGIPVFDLAYETDTFYYVFRMPLDSASQVQVLPRSLCWRRNGREGYVDERCTDLNMAKDGETGDIFLYETRREWYHEGYSQRSCYRKNITFPRSGERSRDPQPAEVHIGDSGLQLPAGDNGKIYAHAYNPLARSFVDIVGHVSASDKAPGQLKLRVRPLGHAAGQDRTSSASIPTPAPPVLYWPPDPTPGQDRLTLDLLNSLMNPQGGHVERVMWASNDKFFVFSPIPAGSTHPGALILLSFDPGLRLHGLRKADRTPERPVPTSLLEMPARPPPGEASWAAPVIPFHLLITSPEGQRYGFDLTR